MLQRLAMAMVLAAGLAMLIASLGASFGAWPWLSMPLQFGALTVPEGGIYVQSGLTALMILLSIYLPANLRMMRLEHSHRDFRVNMEDVARAYAACHQADREGYFKLEREFDAVRERYAFLRDHPELDALEPEILELAAQMSVESARLADTFSVAKVERAQRFLHQRQQEIAGFEDHLDRAKAACAELLIMAEQVEDDEIRLGEKRRAVERELRQTLNDLGFDLRYRPEDGRQRVIRMLPTSSAAE